MPPPSSISSAGDAHTAATRWPTRTWSAGRSITGGYGTMTSVPSRSTKARTNGSVSVWPGYWTGVTME